MQHSFESDDSDYTAGHQICSMTYHNCAEYLFCAKNPVPLRCKNKRNLGFKTRIDRNSVFLGLQDSGQLLTIIFKRSRTPNHPDRQRVELPHLKEHIKKLHIVDFIDLFTFLLLGIMIIEKSR